MENSPHDYGAMIAMLTNAGIEFELGGDPAEGLMIEVVGGYADFFTRITFTPDGKLQKIEAYD